MRRFAPRSLLLALLALGLLAAPAVAVPTVSGEFDVPGISSNNKLVLGPDGNIWIATGGVAGKDVARVTPDGQVEEFEIEAVTPSGIAVGPEGRLWVGRNGGLVSFLPADPKNSKQVFNIADIGTSPSVALGADNNLWVVGAEKENVVRVPPANPAAATAFPVPGLTAPKDIDAAGSLVVIAGFEHIFAVDTAGTVVGDQKVSGQAQGVGGNPNGQYAFTQPVNTPKEIGLLAPGAAPIVRSAEGTDPFGIALGADGAYWSPEFISDGLTRLTADGVVSGLTGFAKSSGPRQIAAGPGNTLWVTLETAKKVGRVSGVEAAPPSPPTPPTAIAAPRTRIKAGPKGKLTTRKNFRPVRFGFASPDPVTAFECRLRKLPPKRKGKGGKASAAAKAKPPKFKRCASPKGYKVKPGRYRFEVRALNQGIPDPTPAKRSFRVVRVAG